MLNHIVIMGRLTRDPELRRTGSGIAVASFTVACDRDFGGKDGGEKETDFIDCVAWRSTGEFVSKYFTKGSMIVVEGRLQIRNWTDKEGNKRRTAEVLADSCYFGESKKNGDKNNAGSYNAPAGGNSAPAGSYGAPAGSYGAPAGGYGAPAGGNGAPAGSYGAPAGGYGAPANNGGFGGYSAPAGCPASDFAMLDDDDAQLPF